MTLLSAAGASAGDHITVPGSDLAPRAVDVRLVPRGTRVALTFDDGPHPLYTPMVLDLLDELDVKATFFVLGFKAENHPEIVRDIVARGHSLQLHGWNHAAMTSLGSGTLRSSLVRSLDLMAEIGVPRPTCVRPPYGATSHRVEDVAAGLGLAVIGWDINSRDYAHQSVSWTLFHATAYSHPKDVLLMHDTLGWIHRSALPQVVDWFRANGIEFDTLCDDGAIPMHQQPSPWAASSG